LQTFLFHSEYLFSSPWSLSSAFVVGLFWVIKWTMRSFYVRQENFLFIMKISCELSSCLIGFACIPMNLLPVGMIVWIANSIYRSFKFQIYEKWRQFWKICSVAYDVKEQSVWYHMKINSEKVFWEIFHIGKI